MTTNKSAHTPGPWPLVIFENRSNNFGHEVVYVQGVVDIGGAGVGLPMAKKGTPAGDAAIATAHLIAAAPELLQAVIELHEITMNTFNDHDVETCGYCTLVAKAEGK